MNISDIAASKGIRLSRFTCGMLSRITHIDFYNAFVAEGYEGIGFCRKAIDHMDIHLEAEGLENLDPDGRYTFVSNHPTGGAEGIGIPAILGDTFGENVMILANDLLNSLHGMSSLSVPVSIVGKNKRSIKKVIDDAFHSDNQIVTFPAGICSRMIDGRLQDLTWKKSFVTESVETGRHIVPVYVDGRNSRRFYRIAAIRKALRIKSNFEMLLLPDELFRQRGNTIRIKFGKPVPPSAIDSSRTPQEWAAWFREQVYRLQ